jgi:outer membrane protein assembly factor BamB
LSYDKKKIKRSWVRRLTPEAELTSNEVSQASSPIVLENGNIIQGTNFGGISEFTFYGRKVWSLESEITNISGSQSVYKNFLFFGTEDKKIHAYDRTQQKIIWSTDLQTAVSAISDFKNGSIFILTTQGQLYALNAADGSVKWTKYIPSRKDLSIYGGPKPVLYKDQVLAAFPNGSVISFDRESGKSKWSITLPGSQKFEDADFVKLTSGGDFYVGVYDEALYKINPSNGSIMWQAFEKPVGEPEINLGKIYFASKDSELVVLQATSGQLVSKNKFFKGIGGKPLFIKDYMVVSDSQGPIVAFDAATLKPIDSYDLISPVSTDVVSNKKGTKFYFISDKGYLYSLGLR